jgi:hypothetical protein
LPSEIFRPDQRIDEIGGDADGDETREDIIQHRLHPRAGRDITDREQKKTGAGRQESKVEHVVPPSKAPNVGQVPYRFQRRRDAGKYISHIKCDARVFGHKLLISAQASYFRHISHIFGTSPIEFICDCNDVPAR